LSIAKRTVNDRNIGIGHCQWQKIIFNCPLPMQDKRELALYLSQFQIPLLGGHDFVISGQTIFTGFLSKHQGATLVFSKMTSDRVAMFDGF
jgi:hypothetical protein